ncbi:hypothetical protein TNCV_2082821 [Trichonephila clavipes]|nr:hypothetical protein TNCV_2082821 [Trichonephila clavipes]
MQKKGFWATTNLTSISPFYMVNLQWHRDLNSRHAGLQFVAITTRLPLPIGLWKFENKRPGGRESLEVKVTALGRRVMSSSPCTIEDLQCRGVDIRSICRG